MKTAIILQSVSGLLLAGVFVATLQAGDLLQPEPGEQKLNCPGGHENEDYVPQQLVSKNYGQLLQAGISWVPVLK